MPSSSSKSDFGQKLLLDLLLREVSSPDGGSKSSNSNSHRIAVFRNGKDSKPAKKKPTAMGTKMALQRMDYGFSQVHVSQIWRGVEKLNQIIKMKDGSMGVHNLDRDSILVGRELLRGAIDLEESLKLLVNLQEDDSNRGRKTRSNVKLIQINDDDDGNVMDRHSENRGRRLEKGRMSSVVMKLMGLEDFPQMNQPEENTSSSSSSSSSSSQLQVTRSHGRRALKNSNPTMAEHKNKKQPFSGGRGTGNGSTSKIDKALQAVKKPETAKQGKRDSLASQKNQRTKTASVGMNQQTDKKKKKKKKKKVETETRIEEEETKIVLRSQVFPNTVEEAVAFLLHTSTDKDGLLDDRKLALDSAFEVTKRKYERYEATFRPHRTVRSLNDVAREVWRDVEMLRWYGGDERDILTMVEKDVLDINSDVNCMWDREWNNVGTLPLRYSDSEDILTEIEKHSIRYVIDELILIVF
ncbi:hypothetical protein M569_03214 [Genlisea aurea]|uniref:DUF3741 domain-containing protein n=1 Tax=Genlisea aurea TaxID=192259 RepID=S8D2B8_9LAMI|nr:hypothetical protein M569_03214 [Genlisea aurea]